MNKKAIIKKAMGKGGPGFKDVLTDSPWWSASMGQGSAQKKSSLTGPQERRLEMMDIDAEGQMRDLRRRWNNRKYDTSPSGGKFKVQEPLV